MKKDFRFDGKRPDDIFEAITAIASRARQINQKRSEDYPIQTMTEVESEEPMINETDFDALEKPASLAMEEYEKGEIEYSYGDQKTTPEEAKE